jgi:hypothetical protein
MSRYTLAADWQDQDPWPSGAYWELGWDEELVTFWARLYEDYGPAEPEDELLPSDREPISSHGERPGELLHLDQLTALMEEELPVDVVAKLEADRDRYLESLTPQAARDLVERLARGLAQRVGRRGVGEFSRLGL